MPEPACCALPHFAGLNYGPAGEEVNLQDMHIRLSSKDDTCPVVLAAHGDSDFLSTTPILPKGWTRLNESRLRALPYQPEAFP